MASRNKNQNQPKVVVGSEVEIADEYRILTGDELQTLGPQADQTAAEQRVLDENHASTETADERRSAIVNEWAPVFKALAAREREDQNRLHHFGCANAHQRIARGTVAGACRCGEPLLLLMPLGDDLWKRDLQTRFGPQMELHLETATVAFRNWVAETGASYLNPEARQPVPGKHAQIEPLTKIGNVYLFALHEDGGAALFEVELGRSGTAYVYPLKKDWSNRSTGTPLPFGLNTADTALFNDLVYFIAAEGYHDTWVFPPKLSSTRNDLTNVVLTIGSEGDFKPGRDPDEFARFNAILDRHGMRYDTLDHVTFALYRK